MDHLGIDQFMVIGFCVGGPLVWNLLERGAGSCCSRGVLAQPVGFRVEAPDRFYESNMSGLGC